MASTPTKSAAEKPMSELEQKMRDAAEGALKACKCLYLELPEAIASDVEQRFHVAFDTALAILGELEAEVKRMHDIGAEFIWGENNPADYKTLHQRLEQTEKQLAAAQESRWQPIATYPKDHLARPVYSMGHGGSMIAFIDVTGEWWPFPAMEPLGFIPTHWRERLVPPEPSEVK